jgi:hypothetical protein
MTLQTLDVSCLSHHPQNTCLVLAIPQSKKQETALCLLGERWLLGLVEHERGKKMSIIKGEDYTKPKSVQHPCPLTFTNHTSQL